MPVLYRKYRPQIFAEVVGQEPVVTTLQNQIKSGQIAHAFLFVGSRGIGKTSVARILAKAVNCQSVNQPISQSSVANAMEDKSANKLGGEKNMVQPLSDALGEACGECEVCKAVEVGNFIDLVEIDAASNTGVDNIRELIEQTKFSPARAKYKVFIIDEAHMLSKGAFNALLKTLEEPPAHAIFILATTEVGKIPPTIISRTQRLDFKRVSPNLIENYLQKVLALEQVKVEEQILKLIAVNAEGGMRDALSLLDKVLSLGSNAELAYILRILGIANISKLEKFAELIFNQQTTLIPEFIKELYEEGVDFITFNKDFLEYLRKILIVKVFQSNSDWGLTSNQIAFLENLSQTQTETKIITIIRLFLRSLKEQNSSPSLDLPVLLAGIEASMDPNRVSHNVKKKLNPIITASNISNLQISTDKNLSTDIDSQLSVENINEKWDEFVKKVKALNGPLANLLRTSEILRVSHQKIFISVKYQFHKQNLEQAKNSDLITKILHEVFKCPLTLISEVKENQASDLPRVEDLSNALKVFGGELVE